MKCPNCNNPLSREEENLGFCKACHTPVNQRKEFEKAVYSSKMHDEIATHIETLRSTYLPDTQDDADVPVIRNAMDLYEALLPKVVIIYNLASSSTGTGFIMKDGFIGTNAHVVIAEDEDGESMICSYYIISFGQNGKNNYKAEVVNLDKECDVAVLRFIGEQPPRLDKLANVLGNSHSLRPGQRLMSIGNSMGFGLSYNEFTVKAETAVHPNPAYREFGEVISMNGTIQGGNSGGPLYNGKGEVIGIITFGMKSDPKFVVVQSESGTPLCGYAEPSEIPGLSYAVTIEALLQLL